MSMTISSNFQEHIHEGLGIEMFVLYIPLSAIIPPLLLLVAFLKNRKDHKQ
jgi:spore germination protein KB